MLIKKNKFNRWIILEIKKTQIMEIRHKEVKTLTKYKLIKKY